MVLAGFAQLGLGITAWLNEKLGWLADTLMGYIITPICFLLYSLQLGLFIFMDAIQGIFRKLAGLDLYYYNGQQQSGDLVMSLIQSQEVMSVFWAVLVVAIMLLFVTTFVAIIRSEFTEKGANPKGPIIGRAIKAIFYFAAVPIVSIMGIFIANVFLRSLDTATASGATSISGVVFSAACYQGNRARQDADFAREVAGQFGLDPNVATQAQVAAAIDTAFRTNSATPGDHNLYIGGKSYMKGYQTYFGKASINSQNYSIQNFGMVYYYYDLLLGYNYLIGYAGGLMAISLLLTIVFGVMQRIYELVILFVAAPPLIAFMPIDDGAKYKKWRDEFIKKVGAMYGPIIGLNLMFLVLTVLQGVHIFPNDNAMYAMYNSVVQMLFLVVGLVSVKEFSSLISSLIGTEDSLSKGEKVKGDALQMAGRIGGGVAATGQMAWRVGKAGFNTASGLARKGGAALGSLGAEEGEKNMLGRAWDTGAGAVDTLRAAPRQIAADRRYLVDDEGKVQRRGRGDRGKKSSDRGLLLNAGYDAGMIDSMDDKTKKALLDDFKEHGTLNTTGEDRSFSGVIADKVVDQKNQERKDKRKDAMTLGTLGKDIMGYTGGQGGGGTGKIWDRFMGSLGKDTTRYGTFKGVSEAYEKGEGGAGATPIFGSVKGVRDIQSQAKLSKDAKESKDAREAQEGQAAAIAKVSSEKDKAMADKLQEILNALQSGLNINNMGSGTSGTGAGTTGGAGGAAAPTGPINVTVDTSVLRGQLSALAMNISTMSQALRDTESSVNRASSEIKAAATNLADISKKWKP